MKKERLDQLLIERQLYASREQARAAVLAGQVIVRDRIVVRPATPVEEGAAITIKTQPRFVSRAGDKLAHALEVFQLDVRGAVAADIGASTGGFTDCLLQAGAGRVYAIDVGYGQLDYRLRTDPRVKVMERVNARYLGPLPEAADLVVADVSFISLTKVLPAAVQSLRGAGKLVVLVKPQFEARRPEVGKGGVIRDTLIHAAVIGRFAHWLTGEGYRILGLAKSPIEGAAGNREFLMYLQRPDSSA